MLVATFIIALIFILLPIASPFLFKIIFKIQKFSGFCLGIICSVITSVSLIVLLVISLVILGVIITSSQDSNLNILIDTFNDINVLNTLKSYILFIIWLIIALLFLTMFLILFFFIKKISKPEDESNTIFMFFSGYILIPALLWYCFCLILSLDLEAFKNLSTNGVEVINTVFVLYVEFGGLFLFILLAGTSIMIMLHHKEYNNLIIWCCVASYFTPLIFYFLGFLTLKVFFFSFLNGACPIISIVLASFLYHKYASSPGNSSQLLGSKVEMAS